MLLSLFEMMYRRIYTKTDEEIEYTLSEYMAKMMSKLNALRLVSPLHRNTVRLNSRLDQEIGS